jgi:hypothetical protein
MLSIDELADGKTFVLKLKDASGTWMQWIQVLRGTVARRWYAIYQASDWVALRLEAAGIFLNPATEAQADQSCKSGRCIVIKTEAVTENELVRPPEDLKAQ